MLAIRPLCGASLTAPPRVTIAHCDRSERENARVRFRGANRLLTRWRGPTLADVADESFAQPAIGRLQELRLAALEKRIDADLALGRHAELEGLAATHPLREGLPAQLMLALDRCGRQADALAAHQAARRTLFDELGIDPSLPPRELEQTILSQDPSPEIAPALAPQRSLLVVPLTEVAVGALLAVAVPLARRPAKELVRARLIDDRLGLSSATAALHEQRGRLLADGIAARATAFTSNDPGDDAGQRGSSFPWAERIRYRAPKSQPVGAMPVVTGSAP
jgi:hypothetical protein